jgi:hypothetical protein
MTNTVHFVWKWHFRGHISAEQLLETAHFCGIIFRFTKESIAHFLAFLANYLGDLPNLEAQNGKY